MSPVQYAIIIFFVVVLTDTKAFIQGTKKFCTDETPLPVVVVEEHLDALNECDIKRLVRLRTDDFKFYLARGEFTKGKNGAEKLFKSICTPFPEGLRGIKFTVKDTFLVSSTLNVRWVASAPFMKDYHGADAYVTRGFKMAAQVTTFDSQELNFTQTR